MDRRQMLKSVLPALAALPTIGQATEVTADAKLIILTVRESAEMSMSDDRRISEMKDSVNEALDKAGCGDLKDKVVFLIGMDVTVVNEKDFKS